MNVLIGCSSSGGHIYPGLALGNYLKKKGHKVTYFGFKNQIEERILINENLILLNCQNSFKKNINFKAIIKLIREIRENKKRFKDFDKYILFGGFISLIGAYYALINHKDYFLHEQNVIIGDSNKIISYKAKKVITSFIISSKNKYIYIGNPVSDEINIGKFTFNRNKKILFMFGSLGSNSLLNNIDFDRLSKYYREDEITIINPKEEKQINNIKMIKYIDFRKEINNFDIIFIRGGATSLKEVLKARGLVVSIPSPYVKHNHQERNVDYYATKGAIIKIKEKEFNYKSIENVIKIAKEDISFCYNQYLNRTKLIENDVLSKMESEIFNA